MQRGYPRIHVVAESWAVHLQAKPPEDGQIVNETGENIEERSSSEGGGSVLGTLGFWLCQSGETL